MKTTFLLLILLCTGMYLNAEINNCLHTTSNWNSEKEAVSAIEASNFRITETVPGDVSSWMVDATFYSCNQDFGFMIVKSDKKTFVHQGVPTQVWEAFKSANSKGGYYNFYIKNKFRIETKKEGLVL
jgi:hypothetical protein